MLIRQVLGAVSQFEKSVIVAKLRAARLRRRRATGRCEGRKPFGAHPGEDRALARMRQLHRKPRGRERLSYGAIAARLNVERLLTRTGAPWRGGTVRYMRLRQWDSACVRFEGIVPRTADAARAPGCFASPESTKRPCRLSGGYPDTASHSTPVSRKATATTASWSRRSRTESARA